MTLSPFYLKSNRRPIWSAVAGVPIWFLLGAVQTNPASAQVALSLGSGSAVPGTAVTLSLSMAASESVQPTALQWTLGYPANAIASVLVNPGAAPDSAGKSITCSAGSDSTICVVYGLNEAAISDGQIAAITLTIAAEALTDNVTVALTGTVASTGSGNSIPTTGTGGTITVTQPQPTATLSSLTCSPAIVDSPGSSACTVTLTGTAPIGGFTIGLASDNANVTVPFSVTVPAGASNAVFTATVSGVTADQTGTVTAGANGVTRSVALSLVAPPQLSGLSCSPATLASGQSTVCTAILTKTAPSGGYLVSLSSATPTALSVPASVTVAAGSSSTTFVALAGSVTSSQSVVITAAGSPSVTTTVTVEPSSQLGGLVAAYPFDEGSGTSANDVSGGGQTGTLINGPTWAPGYVGGAISMDGSNDYVVLPNLDVSGTGITIATWVRFRTLSSTVDQRFISKATDTSEQSHYWLLGQKDNRLRFRLRTGSTTTTLIASSGDLAINTWYHAAAVYDGSRMRIYLNGVEVGSTSKSGSVSTNASVPVNIGRNPDGTNYFSGTLDEMRVYNRGLSVGEIALLSNPAPDATAPSDPANLTAIATSGSQIDLSWTPATDNIGVTGYHLERCQGLGCTGFSRVGTVSIPGYIDTGIVAGTSYSYRVQAADAAGNLSSYSNTATFATTLAQDTTPPTAPGSAIAAVAGSNQINVNWTMSTDNVGVTGYLVERCQGVGCTNFTQVAAQLGTAYSDTGLASGTSYSYRVRATDAATNLSPYSNVAVAQTQPMLTSVGCNPASVNAPGSSSCTVMLNGPALNGGFIVTLASDKAFVTVPSGATVPAGSNTAVFSATVSAVTTDQTATLTASANAVIRTVSLSLVAPAQLSGLSCTPATLASGQSATCTTTLAKAAPSGGYLVSLSSANPTALPLPASVTIAGGSSSATFQATAGSVTLSQPVVITAAGSPPVTTTVTVDPSSQPGGLVAAYSFDEGSGTSVNDASGNGNTGTLTNGPTWTTGPVGGAISLDGTNDYIQLPNLDVSSTGITISAWVRFSRLPANVDQRVISKATDTSEQAHYWLLGQKGNRLRFRLKTGSETTTLIASSGNLARDTWYHAAAVYDGSRMRLYLNGVEVGSTSKSGSVSTNSSVPVNIGRNPDSTNYFSGSIDEVKIYNRGLSASEIALQSSFGSAKEIAKKASDVEGDRNAMLEANRTDPDRVGNGASMELTVRNAADIGSAAFCSPRSWASLYGRGLTAQGSIGAQTVPLPTSLGGVQVRVNNSPVPLVFVSESQVNFQCPTLPANSAIRLTLETSKGTVMAPIEGTMYEATPSLFSLDSSGSGQGAVLIATSNEFAMPRTEGVASRPARRGEYLSIYANGLGETEGEEVPLGMPAPLDRLMRLKNKTQVSIGGVRVEPVFAGLAPGAIGLYQINFAVPKASPTGSAVPLHIAVVLSDGSTVVSNEVTVAIDTSSDLN